MMVAEKCKIVDFEKRTFTEGYTVREVIPAEKYPAYCEKLGYVPELVEPDTDFHLKLTEDEMNIVRYCLACYMSHNYDALLKDTGMCITVKEWRLKVAVVLEHVLFLFPPCKEVE